MKKYFEAPVLIKEIFAVEDLIATSGCNEDSCPVDAGEF